MKKFAVLTLAAVMLTACGGGEEEEIRPVLACGEGMMEYRDTASTLEFCYDAAWGDVVVNAEEAKTEITFSGAGLSPKVTYEAYEHDGIVDFAMIPVTGSDEDLKVKMMEMMGLEESASVRKADISGVRGVRVNDGVNVYYFVPGVLDGKNLTIEADDAFAAEVDDFIWEMIL